MARTLFAMAAALLLTGTMRAAEDKAAEPEAPKAEKAEAPAKDPPDDARRLGSDEACRHTFERAGYPQCVSKWARPTESPCYYGYYVGGGSARFSGSVMPPCPELGTWGRDWVGCWWQPRVMLGWANHYQGRIGAYSSSGPHVPDPVAIAVELPETVHHRRTERKCGEQEKPEH